MIIFVNREKQRPLTFIERGVMIKISHDVKPKYISRKRHVVSIYEDNMPDEILTIDPSFDCLIDGKVTKISCNFAIEAGEYAAAIRPASIPSCETLTIFLDK